MKKIKILISWLLTALLVTSVCACSVSEPAETAEESDSMQESEESAEPSESEKPSETVEPSAIAEEETQEPSILPNAEDLEKLAAGISEEEPRESEDRKENNIWNGSVSTVTVNEFVDAFNAYLKERGPVVTNGTATLSVYTYTDNGDETYLIMFDGEERSGHIFLSFMNGEVAAQGNDYFDSVGVFVANSDVSENPGQWVDAIIATSQLLYFINPEEYISSAETFNDLKTLTTDKLSQRNEVTERWAVNGMDCILKMNITDGSYGFMAIGGEPENAQSNSDKSESIEEIGSDSIEDALLGVWDYGFDNGTMLVEFKPNGKLNIQYTEDLKETGTYTIDSENQKINIKTDVSEADTTYTYIFENGNLQLFVKNGRELEKINY